MKYSKSTQAQRGGGTSPGGENRKPVKAGNGNFTPMAKKVHPKNHALAVPMRGGIRL